MKRANSVPPFTLVLPQFLSDSLSATSAWNRFHTAVHIAICFAIFSDATAGEKNCAFVSRADTLSVFFELN